MDETEDKKKSSSAKDIKSIEITGIIIPIEWDEYANPITFALSAYDEQEYLIDNFTALCTTPQSLLRKKIKLMGTMEQGDKKRKKIIVSHFNILEDDFLDQKKELL